MTLRGPCHVRQIEIIRWSGAVAGFAFKSLEGFGPESVFLDSFGFLLFVNLAIQPRQYCILVMVLNLEFLHGETWGFVLIVSF